jgi:hypothetical protein
LIDENWHIHNKDQPLEAPETFDILLEGQG